MKRSGQFSQESRSFSVFDAHECSRALFEASLTATDSFASKRSLINLAGRFTRMTHVIRAQFDRKTSLAAGFK